MHTPRCTLAKPLWTRGGSDNTKRQTRKRLTDLDGQNLAKQLFLFFRWRKITFLNELVVQWIFLFFLFFCCLFFWFLSNVRPLFFQKRTMHLEATPLEAAEQPRTAVPQVDHHRVLKFTVNSGINYPRYHEISWISPINSMQGWTCSKIF